MMIVEGWAGESGRRGGRGQTVEMSQVQAGWEEQIEFLIEVVG
jgi:hypothetical protein